MPTNNFKLFDEKKANMMSDDDYAINQQRLNGVQSGVASSQLQNKTLYQTALMCYALAQLMAANGYDANDANAVSTFVNNLSLSMVQKVVDKASAADVTNKVAGKWVDAAQLGDLKKDVADNYLPLLGGTMLGDLILNRDPVSSLQAATKQYVDKNDFVIYLGTYEGNGTYGESNAINLTFDFIPLLFIAPYQIYINDRNTCFWQQSVILFNSLSTVYKELNRAEYGVNSGTVYIKKSEDGKTISFYGTNSPIVQQNVADYTYWYAAIGLKSVQ